MSAGHSHAPARAGARYQTRLRWSFVLIGVFFIVEASAGLLTNSLALISDAGHMFTDVLGLGMALAAIHLANRKDENPQRTFGLLVVQPLRCAPPASRSERPGTSRQWRARPKTG